VAVGGGFDDAQLLGIAAAVGADRANRGFTEIAAALAMADTLHGLGQDGRQAHPARAFALQQVPGHPLRAFMADAGEDAQGVDQLVEQGSAQNGSFIPGGKGKPAAAVAIFSRPASSALLTASLNAATSRSSSIS